MRILVGKTFGIGNALLAVPMIKALTSMGHTVDILVGTGPDDRGAVETVLYFMENHGFSPRSLYTDHVPDGVPKHDLAIMSIPYDGRWKNGIHFHADQVMDGRRRPGNVDRLGFDMWEKHEVEYQMENARELGWTDQTPDGLIDEAPPKHSDWVYLGIGYKRDHGGFGLSKHFGTDSYKDLMLAIRNIRPETRFVSTGTPQDIMEVGYRIHRDLFLDHSVTRFYSCSQASILQSIRCVASCGAYLGNDTGMMHMAAAFDLPTFGLFAYKDLLVKNPPYTSRSRALLFAPERPSIEKIAEDFVSFVWG